LELEILAQIFHIEIEMEASKLIFLRHHVLCKREASCSSTARDGRKGIAKPFPTALREAISISDWVIWMFSEKSSMAFFWIGALFNQDRRGCRFRLSSLALERSVGGGRFD
jgi:hypothetical protein